MKYSRKRRSLRPSMRFQFFSCRKTLHRCSRARSNRKQCTKSFLPQISRFQTVQSPRLWNHQGAYHCSSRKYQEFLFLTSRFQSRFQSTWSTLSKSRTLTPNHCQMLSSFSLYPPCTSFEEEILFLTWSCMDLIPLDSLQANHMVWGQHLAYGLENQP